ncbi:hypothetical protein B0H12DRAFT_1083253 [Mycena haematopus]|nr:hypothetical protein B0H12DRAFT_1083253 [Mycena haematopus]
MTDSGVILDQVTSGEETSQGGGTLGEQSSQFVPKNFGWAGFRRDLRSTQREGVGRLDLYGQNAFLNVLMCLKWWRDAIPVASPDWENAVDDVTWVLQQMDLPTASRASPPSSTAIADGNSAGPDPGVINAIPKVFSFPVRSHNGELGPVAGVSTHPPAAAIVNVAVLSVQPAGATLDMAIDGNAQMGAVLRVSGAGTEGLSQEELDEMMNDPDAEMEEEEE